MQNTQLAKSMDHIEIQFNNEKENWQHLYITRIHICNQKDKIATFVLYLKIIFLKFFDIFFALLLY